MKVLHVTPAYEPAWQTGGVVRAISQLCRGLAELGLDVTVYTTDTSGDGRLDVPVNRPVKVGGVTVCYFRSELPGWFRYSRALREACRKTMGEFDLVHLASFWNYPGIPTGYEARTQRVPYLVSTHGTLVPYGSHWKKLKKWLYWKVVEERNIRGAAAIHYITEAERRNTAYLRLPNPSFVVPNSLDFREFDGLPSREDARNQLGFAPDDQVVGYIGRLDPSKALDVLVSAFGQVAKSFPNAYLVIAGRDYGSETLLRSLRQELGLERQVKLLGYIGLEERRQLWAAADLFTLVTHSTDVFGYAAVEAMAAGKPVLVSNELGISQEIEANGAGCVVPIAVDAIARTLEELLSHLGRLREMGRKAYAFVRGRYDIHSVAQLMATAYEDILTGRRSPECHWSDQDHLSLPRG